MQTSQKNFLSYGHSSIIIGGNSNFHNIHTQSSQNILVVIKKNSLDNQLNGNKLQSFISTANGDIHST